MKVRSNLLSSLDLKVKKFSTFNEAPSFEVDLFGLGYATNQISQGVKFLKCRNRDVQPVQAQHGHHDLATAELGRPTKMKRQIAKDSSTSNDSNS